MGANLKWCSAFCVEFALLGNFLQSKNMQLDEMEMVKYI